VSRALVGVKRFQSRSDRERERLQAQISTYAIRHHADRDAEERRKQMERMEEPLPASPEDRLDSFIEFCVGLVERIA
jgi:hypothetical protein